ncbi:hypothetical protein [Dehalococcoides mccartyi]|uniref:hypothetical protein n=1 Tax=Dehalococcoides mccartyi TaxID=61435 RepID=UPI00339693A8
MGIKCNLKLKGYVRLWDADTKELLKETHNMVVSDGQALTGNLLINAPGYDVGISYCAIGTDDTAENEGQHTLVVEASRAQVTQKSIAGNTITVSTFFVSGSCGIHIKEAALFGHSTATMTANSGIMFSRALLEYDNSGTPRNLMISWDIQIDKV